MFMYKIIIHIENNEEVETNEYTDMSGIPAIINIIVRKMLKKQVISTPGCELKYNGDTIDNINPHKIIGVSVRQT